MGFSYPSSKSRYRPLWVPAASRCPPWARSTAAVAGPLRGQRAATDGGGSYAAPVPPGQGALGGAAWQQQTCCPLARRQLGSAPDCVVT